MSFAIIKTGGKQYLVKKGDKVKIEKIAKKEGEKIEFPALLIGDEIAGKAEVGKPLTKTKVSAKILKQALADKVLVMKYKSKTRYHRKVGHRQPYTLIQIEEI